MRVPRRSVQSWDVEPRVLEFGEVCLGKPVRRSFSLVNQGSDPVLFVVEGPIGPSPSEARRLPALLQRYPHRFDFAAGEPQPGVRRGFGRFLLGPGSRRGVPVAVDIRAETARAGKVLKVTAMVPGGEPLGAATVHLEYEDPAGWGAPDSFPSPFESQGRVPGDEVDYLDDPSDGPEPLPRGSPDILVNLPVAVPASPDDPGRTIEMPVLVPDEARRTDDARAGVALWVAAENGELLEVKGERFVIGRGAHCDLVIRSGKVSREHAVIRREGTEFYIEDLKSSNGTWFDKHRVMRRKVEDGDEYFVCSYRIRCVIR